MFEKSKDSISFFFDGERVVIEAWGKNALRVRATKNAAFTGHNWALLPKADIAVEINEYQEQNVELAYLRGKRPVQDDSHIAIKNGNIAARVDWRGVITFTNQKGEVLLKERWTRPIDMPSMSLKNYGRELTPGEGDNYRVATRFEPHTGEKLFGMGQYQMKNLDLKGCCLELAQRNSQASIPFVLSNKGYGFLWNNPAVGRCTFATNETLWEAHSTKQLDYWIVAGDTPAAIEEAYADATGKVPEMPGYGTGFWQCKLRYRTQQELLEVVREHKRRGLPMSVIVCDFFHWPMQGDYCFDTEYWPDPAAMCKELEEMGVELMTSFWPTVDTRSKNYDEMLEKGYLVRTERGVRTTMQVHGQTVFIDPTNPGTRSFVWKRMKEGYWDKGVRIFWLDESEPEYTAYDFDHYRYFLGSDLEVGNIYPLMYAKGFYDGMREEGMENPLNLLRCAWAGSQRYGVLLWSGDVDSTWDSLQRQLRAGLNTAIAGLPWWTTDIGGFHCGDATDPAFHQLLIRWFQYGTFCPVMRLHGIREPRVDSGGVMETGAPNEVWSYGEENYEIMKKYLMIRERLRPYIAAQMKLASANGTPVMRPLFYDFPDDAAAWETDDAYMFGPDILVAPVLQADAATRRVYLPKGAEWTCAWTKERYDGGQAVVVKTPLEQIPLFLRDGAMHPICE